MLHPASIVLQCFLFGYSFFAIGCGSSGRGKAMVNSVENAAADMLAERGGTLSKRTNEVIYEHIDMGDRAGVEKEWRLEIGGRTARREHGPLRAWYWRSAQWRPVDLPRWGPADPPCWWRPADLLRWGPADPRVGHGRPEREDQRISRGRDQQQIPQGGDQRIPEHGTGALPSGDQWIP